MRFVVFCSLVAIATGIGVLSYGGAHRADAPLAIRADRAGDAADSARLASSLADRLRMDSTWRGDRKLHRAAWTLLRFTAGLEGVRVDGVLSEALEGASVFDPLVVPVMVRGDDEAEALARLARMLEHSFAGMEFNRVGVARETNRRGTRVVALLVRRSVELVPPPERVRVGTSWLLQADLVRPATAARVMVLAPGGAIRSHPARIRGGRVVAEVPMPAAGEYRVEVMVTGEDGGPRLPGALATVQCGESATLPGGPAPAASKRPRFRVLPVGGVPAQPEALRADMRGWINGMRRARSLKKLVRDPALDRIATDHARSLARRATLSHMDGAGRGPLQRLRRAGISPAIVGENVAAGLTASGMQHALERSPSHVGEIIRRNLSQMGVGVAERDGVLFTVQLFSGP